MPSNGRWDLIRGLKVKESQARAVPTTDHIRREFIFKYCHRRIFWVFAPNTNYLGASTASRFNEPRHVAGRGVGGRRGCNAATRNLQNIKGGSAKWVRHSTASTSCHCCTAVGGNFSFSEMCVYEGRFLRCYRAHCVIIVEFVVLTEAFFTLSNAQHYKE